MDEQRLERVIDEIRQGMIPDSCDLECVMVDLVFEQVTEDVERDLPHDVLEVIKHLRAAADIIKYEW